jgi:hypothetical protein
MSGLGCEARIKRWVAISYRISIIPSEYPEEGSITIYHSPLHYVTKHNHLSNAIYLLYGGKLNLKYSSTNFTVSMLINFGLGMALFCYKVSSTSTALATQQAPVKQDPNSACPVERDTIK